jgi:hypothetical protein
MFCISYYVFEGVRVMVFNATFNNISVILRSRWRWLKSDKRSCDEYIFVFVFHTEFAFVTFGFGQLFCNQVTQIENASVVCRLTNRSRSHKNKFVSAILKRNLPLSFNIGHRPSAKAIFKILGTWTQPLAHSGSFVGIRNV